MEEGLYRRLHAHLLRQRTPNEQAAFLLCESTISAQSGLFSCLEAVLIEHRQFTIHSEFHLELDDATRAKVIKTAHDRQCSLVEIHSHPWNGPAQFSASDFSGLADFVPHVWWRLRHRPYGALVITPRDIDGLAWIEGADRAECIHAVQIGSRTQPTSGLSFKSLAEIKNEAL